MNAVIVIMPSQQRIDVYTYLLLLILSGERFYMCDEISEVECIEDLIHGNLGSYVELYAMKPKGASTLGAWWSSHRRKQPYDDHDGRLIMLYLPTKYGMYLRRRALQKAIKAWDVKNIKSIKDRKEDIKFIRNSFIG